MLRMQLHRMLPFVHGCRSRTTLMGLLQPRVYYIEGTDMWSLEDFDRVRHLCVVCIFWATRISFHKRHMPLPMRKIGLGKGRMGGLGYVA